MKIVRWDPFKEFFGVLDRNVPAYQGEESTWRPPADIFERGDELVIRLEVPGVDKSDIDIRVEDDTLIIGGERKRDNEANEESTYRSERRYGSFSRRYRLSKAVDAAEIKASCANGVLDVTLPKAEEAKPRKIEIKAA